ncbi:SMC-Scp complex subunit ScpB [Halioxenophilus sp. WMMB6]|uniref:SMC-Scp complex subunit ScpB n=1 Tax=Halioxenophilus sp. WMMB6 TaxID=3073815 RepID=UPI00295F0987|nr:SMC-Scp complex subunit ScpB [Halioxenophilus sp. WMMB6]
MTIESNQLKKIIEGALLAAGQPLDLKRLSDLFVTEEGLLEQPSVSNDEIKAALTAIETDCEGRGFELKEVGSGWRFQVREETAPWVNRLWEEKPQKYSRAMLETLALIAYRQPITRGDIEEIRGVAVSSHIIKTLTEREWVKVVGHRDVPGRPSLYATTKAFLDYFNLKNLEDLPSLGELADLDQLNPELNLAGIEQEAGSDNGDGSEAANSDEPDLIAEALAGEAEFEPEEDELGEFADGDKGDEVSEEYEKEEVVDEDEVSLLADGISPDAGSLFETLDGETAPVTDETDATVDDSDCAAGGALQELIENEDEAEHSPSEDEQESLADEDDSIAEWEEPTVAALAAEDAQPSDAADTPDEEEESTPAPSVPPSLFDRS